VQLPPFPESTSNYAAAIAGARLDQALAEIETYFMTVLFK
jgi:hypothetical protein